MNTGCTALACRRDDHSSFLHRGELSLNYVGRIDRRPGELFHHALHNDPEVTELMLVCRGHGRFLFDGNAFVANEGDLIIYNQGIWHEECSETDRPFKTLFVNFSGLQLAGLPGGFLVARDRSPIVSLGAHYFAIEQRFSEIFNVVERGAPESSYVADQLLGALAGQIVAAIEGGRGIQSTERRVSSIMVSATRRHIHENYSRRLTLTELGAQAGSSPYHLCRVFRRQTGYSPIEYLIQYRMEVAKRYLQTTDRKISAIAALVGYRSETQFQALFRRVVGMPPGQYRVQTREAIED